MYLFLKQMQILDKNKWNHAWIFSLLGMVIILDGISEHVAHVLREYRWFFTENFKFATFVDIKNAFNHSSDGGGGGGRPNPRFLKIIYKGG